MSRAGGSGAERCNRLQSEDKCPIVSVIEGDSNVISVSC